MQVASTRFPSETVAADAHRRLAGFSRLVPQAVGGELVVVTHGDTLRVALGLLDGAPPEAIPWMMPANGAVVSRRIARAADVAWHVVAG